MTAHFKADNDASEKYGISKAQVYLVKTRKTWQFRGG
jgi:hypothetical protein